MNLNPKSKRVLITSSLPYINGTKHLGNLVGSLLPADIMARFLRQRDHEVMFICATDEHGTPAEIAAIEAEMPVDQFCAKMYQVQADIYQAFGLSFDYFGRSSSPQNATLTQHFYKKIRDNGGIVQKSIRSVYSVLDQRYLPDRYVTGTCPYCGYTQARGDQCEGCAKLLDPAELIEPRSTLTGSQDLEIRDSLHLFLRLDLFQDRLKIWVDTHSHWSKLAKSIAHKWLNEGLEERCITRDLQWGVKVPESGFEDKVFYVWFDAPIEYIGATQEYAEISKGKVNWESWWKPQDPSEVYSLQFMAKDNVPFHTIMWPAMIMGTDEPWKQVDQIKALNWLTYYGKKFSTSQKFGIFCDQALLHYAPDYWRYALMCMSPESDDAKFTWELFQGFINTDLANNFGNFINRTWKLISSKCEGVIPTGVPLGDRELKLKLDIERILSELNEHYYQMEFRRVVADLRSLWDLANGYIDERAPWSLLKTDVDQAHMVLNVCAHLGMIFAQASWPIIPFSAEKVLRSLSIQTEPGVAEPKATLSGCLDGVCLGKLEILFKRIEPEEIEGLKQLYGTA